MSSWTFIAATVLMLGVVGSVARTAVVRKTEGETLELELRGLLAEVATEHWLAHSLIVLDPPTVVPRLVSRRSVIAG